MNNPVFHEIIASTRVLTLAVNDLRGLWAASLFFIYHDKGFYYFSNSKSRHVEVIEYSPHVAATIQPEPECWTEIYGLQMSGTQRLVSGADRIKITSHYLARFPFVAANTMLSERLKKNCLVCFDPTEIHLIDNRQGFGQRQQLL